MRISFSRWMFPSDQPPLTIRTLTWILLALVCIHGVAADISAPLHNQAVGRNDETRTSMVQDVIQLFQRSIPVRTLAEIPEHSQCALVHKNQDQCAWILDNCDDQDSGLISYLQLYYCRLPQAKPFAMVVLLFWLTILFSTIGITASDYFCVNLSTISTILGLSESVTGVTLLAFGNGSPDVFSTWAAMSTNSGSLAIGELIGAAGFITGIVAGSMAIVRPFRVSRKSFIRDLGFFIVATAFSLYFLIDGHLDLWECILMVGYYVFYVCVVIVWHWRSKKRKARKARDTLAREHFLPPEYTDNPPDEEEEEDATVGASRGRGSEDEFEALERSEAMNIDGENDEDDDTQNIYMAEITTNMRISRPRGVSRENTRNPIRPSLVGALEFRAVLSSLERSKSQLSIPLYMRRYSDDAVTSLGQQNRLNRANSDLDPIAIPPADPERYRDEPMSARPRAVSTNALDDVRTPTRVPQSARLPKTAGLIPERQATLPRLLIPTNEDDGPPSGTNIAASPALLTPASAERLPHSFSPGSPTSSESPTLAYQTAPSLDVPNSTGPSARSPEVRNNYFTPYHDDPRRGRRSRAASLMLPPPGLQDDSDRLPRALAKWWPYKFLPAPEELFSTLFPTLCNWFQKSYSQKFLALLTAPSVFLLNITLPVVEITNSEEEEKNHVNVKPGRHHNHMRNTSAASNPQTPLIRTEDENGFARPPLASPSDAQSAPSATEKPRTWNRWLLLTQLMFAPIFVVVIAWANIDDDHDTQSLLIWLGVGLVSSIVVLAAVYFTTNEKTPPRYRPIFCILGFIVSVSWISTIANEVVGILKALGIILNISEAILGLTVFAVGSSLGDLVADITIARLGYPMMALSACFGGPMLNILLGIGLSGMYLMVQRGDKYHHKHPDRPVRYKSYHIVIDRTLVVSSVALLITLVGLGIAVPMNGWRMSRRIGWALVGIWVIATCINLGLEIGGFGKVVA